METIVKNNYAVELSKFILNYHSITDPTLLEYNKYIKSITNPDIQWTKNVFESQESMSAEHLNNHMDLSNYSL